MNIMDESTIMLPPVRYTAEGFPGQRMRVIPRPVVEQALMQSATQYLLVTDCGFFPHANRHRKVRGQGLNVAVVIICIAGRGECDLAGSVHRVNAGEVLVIPPGIAHSYQADEQEPWTIWWFHIAGWALPELLDAAHVDERAPVLAVTNVHRLAAMTEEMLGHVEKDETEPRLTAAAGVAWHLLTLLAIDRVPRGSRVDPVTQAQDFLQSRIGTRTSLHELASMVGLSPSHFSALFRAKTGTGVIEYQTRLRMGVAREILDTTEASVEQAARQVGYTDPLYFSRQFRLIHGVSPRDYRTRVRNEVTEDRPFRS